MKLDHDEYEVWIRDSLIPRYPDLERPYRASLEGYERISANNQVDEESLESIVFAASSSRRPLADSAVIFLSDLVSNYQEVREAVSLMLKNPQWNVRFNGLRCLGPDSPQSLALDLLRGGLQDSSHRVRGLAAYKARHLRIQELIPDLERCLGIENNQSARSDIEYNLRLLRDGYCIRRESNNELYILISTEIGIHGYQLSLKNIKSIMSLIFIKMSERKASRKLL